MRFFFKNKGSKAGNISDEEFFVYSNNLHNNDDLENPYIEDMCTKIDYMNDDCIYEELDTRISHEEIRKSLKRNKAHARDNLLNEYFIETIDILVGHIAIVFNAILDSGFFPDIWSEGTIIPLFKKNDINNVNNYRGITLISCFSKKFTGVLNNRISKWVEENNIVSDSQFGFRKNNSTVDAIFILNAVINRVLNNKGRLYCAFIDLKSAFDKVIRNALWYKIHRFGIAKLLRIIRNIYSNIKSCVRNCHTYSDFLMCYQLTPR